MDDCLFCKIAAGEIPSMKVLETDGAFAFLDIHPLSDGHTVVVPKAHSSDITGLPDSDLLPLFSAVREVVARLRLKLGVEHFTIGINHGTAAGQLVEHVHVHVIPRSTGDGGSSLHGVLPKGTAREPLENILKRITL